MLGFIPHIIENGGTIPLEMMPAAAITPKIGLALKFSSGKLAVCDATTVPEYICMTESDSAVTAGTMIPVMRVNHRVVFSVPAQASMASVALGTKVTLHTDGMQVTATATSGVAEIVGREGTAAGDAQYIRF